MKATPLLRALNLLGRLWSLPNTLIGLAFGIGGHYRIDRRNGVVTVDGGWMAHLFGRRGYAGMCVGDVVICAGRLPAAIYRHELVHALQARLLGPLYLPLTVLGYAYGYAVFRQNPHDASPLEIWADIASGNAKHNAWLTRQK